MRNTMPKTIALLAGSALLAAGTAHADRSEWPTNFTVGTASQGGTYFVYGSGWANFIAEELDVSGGGEVTGGPTQNLALVHSGDMAFGLTTMGPASDAIKGESPLAPGLVMDNVCALFPMYETPFSIAALSSSGITSISEIPDGARIGFGPAASTSDTYFPAMLETLGVNFERRNGSWSDLGGQLQDGLIDVVAFAAGIPIPAVSQLEVQTDVNIIGMNDAEAETIISNFPVSEFIIPASTYQSLDAPSRVVSMWNFAMVNCDVSESFVYEITKLTMENNDKMVSIHKAARNSVPENYTKNNVLPWHPGAARWFNENGYPIEDSQIK